jgi:predicted NBD/HSP70 family sugar kinase
MEQFTISIDVGGTKTAYGLLDGQKNIIRRMTHPSNAACSPESFFDQIVNNIRDLMAAGHIG